MKTMLLMSHKMNLGGTEKALLSFLNALEGKGYKVILLLLEAGGTLFNEIPKWVQVEILPHFNEIEPIIFDPPHLLAKKQLLSGDVINAVKTFGRYVTIKRTKKWYINYEFALKHTPPLFQVDVAIAFAGPSDFITYFIHKNIIAQRKLQWIHFDVSNVIYNTNFGNKYYPFFDKIYCVSENAQTVFDKMFPAFVTKTEVFRNIVSQKDIRRQAEVGGTFQDDYKGIRLLTVGRLSHEKGQDMIPQVVVNLLQLGCEFKWYLIGDGVLTDTIQTQINTLGLERHLVLLGSKINPYGFMRDADLYVQTSLHEGYCLTIHEAKMFNKPVVTTAVASASNLIVDNEDGLIVPISVQGLTDGISNLLQNPKRLVEFQRTILAQDTTTEINKLI